MYEGGTPTALILAIVPVGLVGIQTGTTTGAGSLNDKDLLAASQVIFTGTELANIRNGGLLPSNNSLASRQQAAAITIMPKALTEMASPILEIDDGNNKDAATWGITNRLIRTETVTNIVPFDRQDVRDAPQATVNTMELNVDSGLASNFSLAAADQMMIANITPSALTAIAKPGCLVYPGHHRTRVQKKVIQRTRFQRVVAPRLGTIELRRPARQVRPPQPRNINRVRFAGRVECFNVGTRVAPSR